MVVCASLVFLVAGCVGVPVPAAVGGQGGLCEAGFAAAASTAGPSALDDTIRQCPDVQTWAALAAAHPAGLGGRSAMDLLSERCAVPTSADTPCAARC